MGVLKDKLLLEVLWEQFQLVPVRGDNNSFIMRSYKPLPQEIAQLSIAFSINTNSQTVNVMGGQSVAVAHGTASDYEYKFLNSAQGQLAIILNSFLEKKRFKEFSKTFDKEVESELGKR